LTFFKGHQFTQSLQESITRATGLPATTMSYAMLNALRKLGVQRVAVATSYVDELNELLAKYLTEAGFIVTAIRGLSIKGVGQAGSVSTQSLVELSEAVFNENRTAQGIFISCGGLRTLDAINLLEKRLDIPVVASSPAALWDVVRLGRWDATASGAGRLFMACMIDRSSWGIPG
jgi:arylmalonate decarboxylase